MRRAVEVGGLATMLTAGCFNLASIIHLPDGGAIDIPDAGDLADLEFEAIMGAPGPLLDGGTTSFGPLTFTTTFNGQARKLVVSEGSSALQTLVYHNGDDSSVTGTGDTNLDGKVDWRYSSQLDAGVFTTTISEDTNFDGVTDTQDVWIVDTSRGIPFQKTETFSTYLDADGGFAAADAGTWVQQWTSAAVADANQGTNDCDGMVGFPTQTNQTLAIPNTQIQIVNSCNAGGCSNAQTTLLAGAFRQALQNFAIGIAAVNAKAAAAVKSAVQTRPLLVACGNTCAAYAATTDLPGSTWSQQVEGGPQRMNLNASLALRSPTGGDRTVASSTRS